MTKRNADAKRWLINRLKKKNKIPAKTTEKVLNAIADLEWDWANSKYDLYGLCLEEILIELGASRTPKDKP